MSVPRGERAILAQAIWDELEEMSAEEFADLAEDADDPRWNIGCSALLAGEVCRELGLIPYGPEYGDAPPHWRRFYGVPVIRVYAMVEKARTMDSAARAAYLENWTKKHSTAFGESDG